MEAHPWQFGWDQLLQLLQVITIAGAAVAGWLGVRTWRDEHRDRRKAELAEEAMGLLYDAPEVFRAIRDPASMPGEGATRGRDENEDPAESRARDLDFVPIERVVEQNTYFNRVRDIRSFLRMYFGEAAAQPFNDLLSVRTEIIHAAVMRSRLRHRDMSQRTEDQREKHYAKQESFDDVVWGSADDEISRRIDEAVNEGEIVALPLLRGRLGDSNTA